MNSAANIERVGGRNAMTVTDKSGAKNLRALFAGLSAVALPDIAIADLTLDSRRVVPGAAFIALPGLQNSRTGARSHGINFAQQAVASGASVVLWEPIDQLAAPAFARHVTVVAISGLSSLVGTIADRFFDAPSQAVNVNAVTGTNGKTTTAYVLAAALSVLGKQAAYAGTLGYGRIGALQSGTHTTPDSITVHREIAELRADGVSHLGIEVSSHALDQQRIAGVRIDTAVFTNLTRDHLDYHGTLDAYGQAKARLFSWPGLRHAVINMHDAFGRQLALHHTRAGTTTLYGRASQLATNPLVAGARYVVAKQVTAAPGGLQIDVQSSWGEATIHSHFIGDFNVDNLLAVLSVLLGAGFALDDAVAALAQCVAPPGRMETFAATGRPLAIVDYAHTPDALAKALAAARRHCSGRLFCVFGCGGDRDASKRAVMGEIAERLADVAVITDDNPRTEDGGAIIAAILQGMAHPQCAIVERQRAVAIQRAIAMAAPADVVLIAGKGHEDYQIIGLETRYFSDRDVATAALRSGS